MVNESALNALDADSHGGLLHAYEEAGRMSGAGRLRTKASDAWSRMAPPVPKSTSPLVEKMDARYQDMAASADRPQGFLQTIDTARTSTR
ncbi:hypothetical protein [Salipiger aestuarii]|uniref:hypothetical protein n=1 Tax=Salipiger aestuarii TaxID=568098 RepID=UPI00123B46EC|nr:hypothetical protein [Salipiger aestuarii]KAA8606124.1 hypothetical protein AL037_20780 [Salipiger aestuarii]